MNFEMENIDNQSVMSDITDFADNTTVSSTEIIQKLEDIRLKTETDLNKLTIDVLKEKCRENNIVGFSKMKKPDLVQLLLMEFSKLWGFLKDKKNVELKNICKTNDIKGIAGFKKEELSLIILSYYSTNLKFKLDDNIGICAIANVEDAKPKIKTNTNIKPLLEETTKLTTIEDLEKQRQEIEFKMKEEIEKQKKIAEEEIKKKLEEEQKLAEETKKKEKEEAKKKKQSIPKQVRIIVWNHYIGEDIIKHRCLCCKKVIITNTNFDVGHVLSEKNGGTHEINNLRPICGACNHSMGTENMVDFVVKSGLYIG